MNASIPIAVGFAAAAVFMIWHEKSRQKRISQEYDEMQLRIRGKGAWYSFYSIILYMALYMLLEKAGGFALLSAADYVTEMKKIKHPFDEGKPARLGVEF